MPQPLGRREPTDFEHIEKYPLRALPEEERPRGAPAVIGVHWYDNFDKPVKDGLRWWIGRGELGPIRGGHAIAVLSEAQKDQFGWYHFYAQNAGSCCGFSSARMMSLFNRRRYNPYWLWDRAKERDEWSDTNPGDGEGTSVRATFDVLRTLGAVRAPRGEGAGDWTNDEGRNALVPALEDGIVANRWATTVDEFLQALASPSYERIGAVPLLNSWGTAYPRRVWLPLETLARLLGEHGELGMPTDR